MTESVDG